MQTTQTRGKEKTVAGILGILLGGFGAHHFYLGSTNSGLIMLGATVVTCGLASLVGLAEGILLLVMPQDEFDQRYNARAPEPIEFVFSKPKTMGGPPPPPYQP